MSKQSTPMISMYTLYRESARKGKEVSQSFSYPVPTRDGGSLRIAFLYYHAQIDFHGNTGRHDLPPEKIGVFDPTTGELLKEQRVTRQDFGRPDDPHVSKSAGMAEGLSPKQADEWEEKLFDAYDVLVPLYGRGDTSPVTPEVERAGKDFQKVFPVLAEQPLLPYYRALGKDFFAWLDRVSPPPPTPPAAAPPADAAPSASTRSGKQP